MDYVGKRGKKKKKKKKKVETWQVVNKRCERVNGR